ncbi:chorismate mutase [Novosphingobium jiangmenense]|uniref:chorismate mutase n=1 Tax=Novosphingobium jiangmenense TaxID=2791981 RepID=A0ABS0HDC6_9SPHN|nr:chorismate mutase [Novosphingobium jiangmenense]MBF9150222.1 chorismate mutase [Novosphingobium jiangmenense]
MESVSDGVESIDLQILSLLSQRFGLAAEAGGATAASDDQRKMQLSLIRRRAFELGIPVALVTDFWDRLMDASEAIQAQRSNRAIND